MTNVRITQNGTTGHFVQKVAVVVFIKDIGFVSMAISGISGVQQAKTKSIKTAKRTHVRIGDHGRDGVPAIRNVDVVIKSPVVVANMDTKIFPAVEDLT